MADLETQRVILGPVTLHLLGCDSKDADAPLLFLLHGRCGHISKLFGLAEKLRNECRGVRICLFDMANHGERLIDKTRNLSWVDKTKSEASPDCPGNPHHAVDMYSQIVDAARTISLALDFLPTVGIGYGRVGVVGVSQGAHAALHAFAHEPRVFACVSLMGSADYAGHMRARYASLTGKEHTSEELEVDQRWARLFPKALGELCNRLDPINNLERLCDRPLLLVHGDADDLVLPKWSSLLMQCIQDRVGSEPERLQASLCMVPGVGHSVSEEMMDATAKFIAAKL